VPRASKISRRTLAKLFKREAMTKDSLDPACLGGGVVSWRKNAEITKVDVPSIDEIQVKLLDFGTLSRIAPLRSRSR